MIATTRELANQNNLTYTQARYLIDQSVIKPKPAKGGRAWELSSRDLWFLDLAALLSNKKVPPKAIRYYVESLRDSDQAEPLQYWFVGLFRQAVLIEWDKKEWVVYVGHESFKAMRDYANGVNLERYKTFKENNIQTIGIVEEVSSSE